MKLLLFSDIHANVTQARSIAKRSKDFDVLIGAGDFATQRRNLDISIDILKSIDKPTVIVPGNNESVEELREACRAWPSAHVLHGSSVKIQGLTFFGIGGGIPTTPFGSWSYDFSEDQARDMLVELPIGSVLISHSPPKGAVDVNAQGVSMGSVAVREAIERTSPRLVVCGHIHACGGRLAKIGDTSVVNAGPHGVEWTL